MRFHFITPVWGQTYIDAFTELSLPTQLATGNLGNFLDDDYVTYEIVTRAEDISRIKSSRSVQFLSRHFLTEFSFIDDFDWRKHPYILMTDCYNRVMKEHTDSLTETAFFFLTADLVWSDGAFKRTREILEQGKRAVMIDAGFHVNKESFISSFLKTFSEPDVPYIQCPPRLLLKVAFEHMHDITKSMIWDGGYIINMVPAHIYWIVGHQLMLGRSWVLHPVAARPRIKTLATDTQGISTSPIDHEYIRLACPNFEEVHICTDSDEILAVEMSDAHHLHEQILKGRYYTRMVSNWLGRGWVNKYHLKYAKKCYWYHGYDIPPAIKAEAEELSERLMLEIQRQVPFQQVWHQIRKLAISSMPGPVKDYLKRKLQTLRSSKQVRSE